MAGSYPPESPSLTQKHLTPALSGPLLLATHDSIPDATMTALTQLEPDHITIGGGSAVLSEEVALDLASYVVPGP